MNYDDYSRKQLLERIEELEVLNREMMIEKERETRLEYAWTGNLGQWYFNVKTNTVSFNPLKTIALGYEKEEIPEHVTYQFFTEKLHPEDYEKTMNAMYDHLYGKAKVYEIEYRIRTKVGNYKWFYDRGMITQYDDNGKPVLIAGIVFDVTDKKEMELELQKKNLLLAEQASTDGLTRIANHKTIIEQLRIKIADANINNDPFSVAIFDLDDFKAINDTKGHIYGDRVLFDVATIIKNNIRKDDIAGRYGGEEFFVIFSNSDLAKAAKVSERIRVAIEESFLVEDLKITISGGVKQYNGEELSELIHLAYVNLYEAKRKGKNQILY